QAGREGAGQSGNAKTACDEAHDALERSNLHESIPPRRDGVEIAEQAAGIGAAKTLHEQRDGGPRGDEPGERGDLSRRDDHEFVAEGELLAEAGETGGARHERQIQPTLSELLYERRRAARFDRHGEARALSAV